MILSLILWISSFVSYIENKEIVYHTWFPENIQKQILVNYAYELGWIDFVKMIECENWNRDPNKISATNDYWLCQLNYRWNKNFILSKDFKNPLRQLDFCSFKWHINPKLRYWPYRYIKGKKCLDYVSNRFIIKKLI